MKVYAINLAKEEQKKNYIINECNQLGLEVEIFDAVNGSQLSNEFINTNVMDFPNCYLTKGEIGCALSHINIYKKIMEDGLPYALIIEDDAVLDPKLTTFISDFKKYNNRQGIFLLTGNFQYFVNKKFKLGKFDLFPIETAINTTGYIITLDAAKKMVEFLLPVRYEADMFKIFHICTGVNIFGTIPHLISTNDKDKSSSVIEEARKLIVEKRKDYRHNLFKRYEKRRKIYHLFRKIFIKPYLKKCIYKDY